MAAIYKLAGRAGELRRKKKMVVKVKGKQLLLLFNDKEMIACNNRCPHEGYPLSEGSLTDDCILTCNWHNWKFDLKNGETLVGGDKLRRYPAYFDGADIKLDLSDPPAEEIRKKALENLEDCFDRHEYDRMGREIARLQKAGGDPLDALRHTIRLSYDRMEFGATHAFAGSADWLRLYDRYQQDPSLSLVAIIESVGHFAWDIQLQPRFAFTREIKEYDQEKFIQAIENEDEDLAVALLRGGFAAGMQFGDFEAALSRAALAHYNDFGHSIIYVYKAGQLIDRLGDEVKMPVMLALLRSLVYASREDLIPAFRAYGEILPLWDGTGTAAVTGADFDALPVRESLHKCLKASADIPALYKALLEINARNMLHFDLQVQARSDNQVAHNVGWLDFTHGLTFANAVRVQCEKFPELWPQALLQMACFSGRNMPYTDSSLKTDEWQVESPEKFFEEQRLKLFDHGNPEYIVSCHLIKLLTAAEAEYNQAPKAGYVRDLLASVNRFLQSPLKRKHTLRTARQSLAFVARED